MNNKITYVKKYRFPKEEVVNRENAVIVECGHCGVEYGCYKSRIAKYCSKECMNPKKYAIDNFDKYFDCCSGNKKKVKKYIKEKGVFEKEKHKYEPNIINYDNSPTGKVYVGHAKSPFMKTKTGIGFQGVILQDENRKFVQCYECGKWFRMLTNRHLKKCSGSSIKEYKEKFGLLSSRGVVADETSMILAKNALQNKSHLTEKGQKQIEKMRKKSIVASKKRKDIGVKKIAYQNNYGTCPLQLLTRLVNFINCNHELPNHHNRGGQIYKAIRRRYGSFPEYLRKHGLPYFKRTGTNMMFQFPDGEVYWYNINQWNDREELYFKMYTKCPILSDVNLEKYLNQSHILQ